MEKVLKDSRGNVAMVFAGSVMALLLGAGAAIDLSGAAKMRSTYQGYSDAAVLAAARSGETDRKELRKIAKAFVDANNIR